MITMDQWQSLLLISSLQLKYWSEKYWSRKHWKILIFLGHGLDHSRTRESDSPKDQTARRSGSLAAQKCHSSPKEFCINRMASSETKSLWATLWTGSQVSTPSFSATISKSTFGIFRFQASKMNLYSFVLLLILLIAMAINGAESRPPCWQSRIPIDCDWEAWWWSRSMIGQWPLMSKSLLMKIKQNHSIRAWWLTYLSLSLHLLGWCPQKPAIWMIRALESQEPSLSLQTMESKPLST